MATAPHAISQLFIELELVVVLLAVLARVENRLGSWDGKNGGTIGIKIA